jgi:hypothetical protein
VQRRSMAGKPELSTYAFNLVEPAQESNLWNSHCFDIPLNSILFKLTKVSSLCLSLCIPLPRQMEAIAELQKLGLATFTEKYRLVSLVHPRFNTDTPLIILNYHHSLSKRNTISDQCRGLVVEQT